MTKRAVSAGGRRGGAEVDRGPVRVLVVEESAATAALIRQPLEGLMVDHVRDLAAARARLATDRPDVVVLDVDLPDGAGLELLRESARSTAPPIVILSSRQDEAGGFVDLELGLELGAEDFVTKPFLAQELATRVRRAASRRRGQLPARLQVGDLLVDLTSRVVKLHGKPVELTTMEFDLLAHFASSPGRLFGRDELLREVWKSSPEWQSPKTVNEHLRRLRRKIEDDPARPRRIVTAGRAGYRLGTP